MNRYYYDLHIHSCLSPCADNDCTPDSIAGMGVINGLNMMALTDHNTCKNCPAFFAAAQKNGIIPIAGMELTSAEDIHLICLFPELKSAMEFDTLVSSRLIPIKNRPDIFGEQLIVDENDEVIGYEENLLINATDISIDEAFSLTNSYGGICYPAHIDRESNGILAILGFFPPTPEFSCIEFNDAENIPELSAVHHLSDKLILVSSDAHNLWSIKERAEYFELDDEPYSSAFVRKKLFEALRGHRKDLL